MSKRDSWFKWSRSGSLSDIRIGPFRHQRWGVVSTTRLFGLQIDKVSQSLKVTIFGRNLFAVNLGRLIPGR